MSRHSKHCAIILGVACFAFFTNLGATHLWDEDEGFFAGCAAEMFSRHDWVVPFFNGEIFSHKPPFMYWMMMCGFEIFGVTEFAARLGSAIFGVFTALLIYQLGRRLFCAEVGLYAALIITASLMFNVVARAATPDSYLVFFFVLAFYLFTLRSKEESVPKWGICLAMYLVMGLAVLVKGPIGFLLPMASMGLFLLCTTTRNSDDSEGEENAGTWKWLQRFGPRNFLRCLWKMRPMTATIAVLVVAGPWYYMVGQRTHGQFLTEFFGTHNFGRFLNPMQQHQGSIFYYVPAILIGFFPASIFMIPTLIDVVGRIRNNGPWNAGVVLLVCWAAVVVVFFSLAGTKLPNYVLPAYPPLALLTACCLHRWVYQPTTVLRWLPRASFGALALVGASLWVGPKLFLSMQFHGQPIYVTAGIAQDVAAKIAKLSILGAVPFFGAIAAIAFAELGSLKKGMFSAACAGLTLTVGLLAFVSVEVDGYQYAASLMDAIPKDNNHSNSIAQFKHNRPTLSFYAHQPIKSLEGVRDVELFFERNGNSFLITTEASFPELKEHLSQDVMVVATRPQFPKRGVVMLLGRQSQVGSRPKVVR